MQVTTAFLIKEFREKLASDPENRDARRIFHETYEWFEGFLNTYKKNEFDKFCEEYEDFYWKNEDIRKLANDLAFYPPVGSSNQDFEPTITIKKATFFLRSFFLMPLQDDEKLEADKWKKSEFYAVLEIIKQIRNNLFHGMKMNLMEEQYERNKKLIIISSQFMTLIIDNLEDK